MKSSSSSKPGKGVIELRMGSELNNTNHFVVGRFSDPFQPSKVGQTNPMKAGQTVAGASIPSGYLMYKADENIDEDEVKEDPAVIDYSLFKKRKKRYHRKSNLIIERKVAAASSKGSADQYDVQFEGRPTSSSFEVDVDPPRYALLELVSGDSGVYGTTNKSHLDLRNIFF